MLRTMISFQTGHGVLAVTTYCLSGLFERLNDATFDTLLN